MMVARRTEHVRCDTEHVRCDWRRRRAASVTGSVGAGLSASSRLAFGAERRWMVVRQFVDEAERAALLRKALTHMQRGELMPNRSGPYRYFAKVDDEPARYADALLERLTRRCERCLRLAGVRTDCVLGRTISLILPGGFIHPHTDKYHEGAPGHRVGMEHCRCNIMVRLAHPSGRPIIEATPLPVEEGDLWAFHASKSVHETQTLQGSEPRIIFGFGWSVAPSHALEPPPDGWRNP